MYVVYPQQSFVVVWRITLRVNGSVSSLTLVCVKARGSREWLVWMNYVTRTVSCLEARRPSITLDDLQNVIGEYKVTNEALVTEASIDCMSCGQTMPEYIKTSAFYSCSV